MQGAIEFGGGAIGQALADRTPPIRFRAMTLGHVILGASAADLDAAREHEQVHVRQYERWGPFFLPAYLLSSAWQLVTGRRCYRDNYFERQAYDHAPVPCARMRDGMSATIRRIESAEAPVIAGLCTLLADAVDDGASVGFLAPMTQEKALGYWQPVIADA